MTQEQINQLLTERDELKADLTLAINTVTKVMQTVDLVDGEGNLKKVNPGSMVMLATKLMTDKKKQQQLSFIGDLVPLFKKYSHLTIKD